MLVGLVVHVNQEGIGLFTYGFSVHTDAMRIQGLKQALDKYGFDTVRPYNQIL